MLEGRIPKDRERKKYMHESRHRHALNRARGKGGVFDSKDGDTPKRGKGTSGPMRGRFVNTPSQFAKQSAQTMSQHKQEVDNIQMSDKENSSGQDWHFKREQMAIPFSQKINLLRRAKLQ